MGNLFNIVTTDSIYIIVTGWESKWTWNREICSIFTEVIVPQQWMRTCRKNRKYIAEKKNCVCKKRNLLTNWFSGRDRLS